MSAPQTFMMKSRQRQLPPPDSPQYSNQPNNRNQVTQGRERAQRYPNQTREHVSSNRENANDRDDSVLYDTVEETALRRTLSDDRTYTALMKEQVVVDTRKRWIFFGALALIPAMGIIIVCSLLPTLLLVRQIEMEVGALQNTNCTIKDFQGKPSGNTIEPGLRVVHDNTCYCLYTHQITWFQARSFCDSKAGLVHLAELRDSKVKQYVEPILMAFIPQGTALWIGGNDLEVEGVMKWNYSNTVVDTFTPSQWGPGEPDGQSANVSDEHCIEVAKNYGWNDVVCNGNRVFLCQSPLNAENQCDC